MPRQTSPTFVIEASRESEQLTRRCAAAAEIVCIAADRPRRTRLQIAKPRSATAVYQPATSFDRPYGRGIPL